MSTGKTYVTTLLSLVLPLLWAGSVRADESKKRGEECPVATKVTSLLSEWEVACQKTQSQAAIEQEELTADLCGLAETCPVGSRLGETVSTVRDVLAFVLASQEAGLRHCPLEKADPSDPSCAAGKELKAARGKALGKLHELASFTAGANPASTSCSESCSESAGQSACPIRIASRLGALKASWEGARVEAAALPAKNRQAILAGFASLEQRTPVVSLVPRSVFALSEGFDALGSLHEEIFEWAQENPKLLAELPESAHVAFQIEHALLEEAREVLGRVVTAMQTMQEGQPAK